MRKAKSMARLHRRSGVVPAQIRLIENQTYSGPNLRVERAIPGPRKLFISYAHGDPDQMLARLQADIARVPRALPAAERPRRIAELEQQIVAAEREEEAWIASGAAVERRSDASPAVMLGVRAA